MLSHYESAKITPGNTAEEYNKTVQNIAEEYSKVIPRSLRNENKAKTVSCSNLNEVIAVNEYASVIPKALRPHTSSMHDIDNLGLSKHEQYVFAVAEDELKKTEESFHVTPDQNKAVTNEYSTVVPRSSRSATIDMNCEYAKPIPRMQRLLDIHGLDSVKTTTHEYDTPSPLNKRRKVSVSVLSLICTLALRNWLGDIWRQIIYIERLR